MSIWGNDKCISTFWIKATFKVSYVAFFSEGTDAFVISSNRQRLLFSWAWILNLWYFKGLKSCHIRPWCSSEGSNSKMEPYLSLQSLQALVWHDLSPLRYQSFIFKLRKIKRFVCLRKCQMHQYTSMSWLNNVNYQVPSQIYSSFYGLKFLPIKFTSTYHG